MTLNAALKAISMAEKKASELGVKVSIAVVDNSGITIASAKMDGSISISPEFAYTKAYTSASIGAPSKDLEGYAEEGKPYYGLNSIFGGKLTTIAGGQPVMIDGKLVGGVGVGGSMDVGQDNLCAIAALEAFK